MTDRGSKRQKVAGAKYFLLKVPNFVVESWKSSTNPDCGVIESKTDARGNEKLSLRINYDQSNLYNTRAAKPEEGVVNLRSGGNRMAIFEAGTSVGYLGRVSQVGDVRMNDKDPRYNDVLKTRVSKSMIKTSVTQTIAPQTHSKQSREFNLLSQYTPKYSLLLTPVYALNEGDAMQCVRTWIKGSLGPVDFLSIKRRAPAPRKKRNGKNKDMAQLGAPQETMHDIIVTFSDSDKHAQMKTILYQRATVFANEAWRKRYPDAKLVAVSASPVAAPAAVRVAPVKTTKNTQQDKRTRMLRPQLEGLILQLFQVKNSYSIKELFEHTNQPKQWLQEVVNSVCDKDPRKHVYTLKEEYASQASSPSGSGGAAPMFRR